MYIYIYRHIYTHIYKYSVTDSGFTDMDIIKASENLQEKSLV
jgi:hypothetical protein